MSDSLGDRMKGYENAYRYYLPRRLPVIIRVDGRAFHTLTHGFQRPFDRVLAETMWDTAAALCKEISGAKLAYTQSDEISVLITNNDTVDTQPWFDNSLQKLASLSASTATLAFNGAFQRAVDQWVKDHTGTGVPSQLLCAYETAMMRATFDARAFVLPPTEVCNYFIWRQQDAVRNSIQMAAQAVYSHKALQYKNQSDLQEMLFQKGINWNNCETWQKRGVCIVKKQINPDDTRMKWAPDFEIPVFTQHRAYIDGRLPENQEGDENGN